MVLLLASCPSNLLDLNGSRRREIVFPCSSTLKTRVELGSSIFGRKIENKYRGSVKAFFFNPFKEPILKDAIKEPVAFMGGVFAGLLRLDLNEDPLREWVSRNVEALGIKEDELADDGSKVEEQIPIQIDIE
ncbi:UPF0426 protein At1g28150, chloroplastic isoform X2 [Carica papaya]|uniref:UPF0426 protein At1g28150, chloroplastic isoform X2 n=1 Tax=Carica papaya TaxID=3649 RepID=UPI000B8D1289|nr:UPF0426 protein At1g28150, chloroplastic isoform X2 [Carica papaya]